MNIFATDKNPIIAAQNLCDCHIVKMIVESAQLLCTYLYFEKYETKYPLSWFKCKKRKISLVIKGKKYFIDYTKELKKIKAKKYKKETGLYIPTHVKHPCRLWLKESFMNSAWLMLHLRGLLEEYTYRYNKYHSCEKIYDIIAHNIGYMALAAIRAADLSKIPIQDNKFINFTSDFALAMPEQYKTSDYIESYRNYYMSKQYTMKIPMRWTKRQPPDWFIFKGDNNE